VRSFTVQVAWRSLRLMRMKTSTVVFWVVFLILVGVGLSLHLMGADVSGWMDGMKKLHGRG